MAGGSKKEFLDKSISSHLEKIIQGRSIFKATKDDAKFVPILLEGTTESYYSEVISPIICEGDAIGAVIFLSANKNNAMGEVEEKLAYSASGFIGKQMEQ